MKFSLYLARKAAADGDLQVSLMNYFTVLATVECAEERERKYGQELADVLQNFIRELDNNQATCLSADAAETIWSTCEQLFPHSPLILNIIGEHAFQMGAVLRAVEWFSRALAHSAPSSELSLRARANRVNLAARTDAWHVVMLNDKVRNSSFERAIRAAVRPRHNVLDIGTGTGLLAMIAANVDQSVNVLGVEDQAMMYAVAQEVVSSNRTFGRIMLAQCNSNDRYDRNIFSVVVSETLDCGAFGEGIVASFAHAHQHLAADGAVFIPEKVALRVRLLSSSSIHSHHTLSINQQHYYSGFVINQSDSSDPYWACFLDEFADAELLSETVEVVGVNLASREETISIAAGIPVTGRFSVQATKAGTVHALAGHFCATLFGDIVLDSSASDSCWETAVFVLPQPVRIEQGDKLHFTFTLTATRVDVVYCGEEGVEVSAERGRVVYADYAMINDQRIVRHVVDSLARECRRVLELSELPTVWSRIADTRHDAEVFCVCSDPEWEEAVPDGFHTLEGVDDEHMPRERERGRESGLLAVDVISHWPLEGCGVLRSLSSLVDARMRYPEARVVPSRVTPIGRLVSGKWIENKVFLDPSAHLSFDLSALDDFTPHEYRDIDPSLHPFSFHSAPFPLLDIECGEEVSIHQRTLPSFVRTQKETHVEIICGGEVLGVLYWWNVDGVSTWEEGRRGRCAFLKLDRRRVQEGQTVKVNAHLYRDQILVDIGE